MSREINKPETTEKYHRIPVRDCEITSTITISDKEGIKALYCGKIKEIATYLFDVDKWSMEEAKKWVSENKKSSGCNKKKSIERKNNLNIKGKINIPADILLRSDGRRIIAGYASIAEVDLEDDLITTDALKSGLDALIEDERYANIMLSHSDIQIGHILKEYKGLKTHVDDKGLFLIAEIRKGFKYADEIWNDILNGDINGFSIAGYVEEGGEEQICNGDTCWNEIKNIVLFETSICEFPCNQKSGFIVLSKNLKSYNCECLECGYSVETEKHCKDLICPKCGGEMRRVERPGIGKDTDSNKVNLNNDVNNNVENMKGDKMPDKEEKSTKEETKEEETEEVEDNPLDELHKSFETLAKDVSGITRRLESLEKVVNDIMDSKEEEPEEKSEETSEEETEEKSEEIPDKEEKSDEPEQEKSEDSEEECEDCKASKGEKSEEKSEDKEPDEDVEKSEEEAKESEDKVEKSEDEVDESDSKDDIDTFKKSLKDRDELIESMEKKISEMESKIKELEEEEQPRKAIVKSEEDSEECKESNIVVEKGKVYYKKY